MYQPRTLPEKFIRLIKKDLCSVQLKISRMINTTNKQLCSLNPPKYGAAFTSTVVNKYYYLDDRIIGGGQQLRALLLLLAGYALRKRRFITHINLATAIELIHAASLLHDDVLDHASRRRQKITVHMQFDNKFAILAGDLLYSNAFDLISNQPNINTYHIMKDLAATAKLMVSGEILQWSNRFNFQLDVKQYIKIITAKTARLFMAAMALPALLDYSVDQQRILAKCGLNFGVAYQIIDDVKDYYEEGNDIIEGNINFPVISILHNQQVSTKVKLKIINIIRLYGKTNYRDQKIKLSQLRSIISQHGGFAAASILAIKYLTKAKAAIYLLPNSAFRQEILDIIVHYENYPMMHKQSSTT